MDQKKLLKAVNAALALDLLALAGSGIVQGAFGHPIPYETFRAAHPVAGYLAAALVAVHLWLNRAWIRNAYFAKGR